MWSQMLAAAPRGIVLEGNTEDPWLQLEPPEGPQGASRGEEGPPESDTHSDRGREGSQGAPREGRAPQRLTLTVTGVERGPKGPPEQGRPSQRVTRTVTGAPPGAPRPAMAPTRATGSTPSNSPCPCRPPPCTRYTPGIPQLCPQHGYGTVKGAASMCFMNHFHDSRDQCALWRSFFSRGELCCLCVDAYVCVQFAGRGSLDFTGQTRSAALGSDWVTFSRHEVLNTVQYSFMPCIPQVCMLELDGRARSLMPGFNGGHVRSWMLTGRRCVDYNTRYSTSCAIHLCCTAVYAQ